MKCCVNKCKKEHSLVYLNKPYCKGHWGLLCDREIQQEIKFWKKLHKQTTLTNF